uniref:SsfS5 n=1 Tax=Streptomyces sp. SF2575 TaxID=746675 RepID=D6MSV4_9ACTN|nr:SsfS5 [Streptomyces sp. SF2575]
MVLGGTGYVGRHVCEAFAGLGHDVLAVGRDPTKAAPGVPFAALGQPEELYDLLPAAGPQVVVNAAGGVWEVSDEEMVGANVSLVEHLLAATGRLGDRPRLVHLGSAHEYGATPHGAGTSESVPTRPLTAYGRAKLRATRLVCDAFDSGQLDGTVLRLSNVLGPTAPRTSLLGAVVARLREAEESGRPAVLTLNAPRAYRDFVDARDVTAAVVAAAAGPARPASRPAPRVVNVGGGDPVPVRLVMERLIDISGAPAEIVEQAPAELTRDNGDWQQLDISTARDTLGWVPRRTLAQSLVWAWEAGRPRPLPAHRARAGFERESSPLRHSPQDEEGH